MESYSTTIVVFWIFAVLCQIATIAFVVLDQNSKEQYKWLWVILMLFVGPIGLIPYWFWGRER